MLNADLSTTIASIVSLEAYFKKENAKLEKQ